MQSMLESDEQATKLLKSKLCKWICMCKGNCATNQKAYHKNYPNIECCEDNLSSIKIDHDISKIIIPLN